MIYLSITSKNNESLFSNIEDSHSKIFVNNKNSKSKTKHLRSFYKELSEYNVWIISNDADLYKSNKLFKKTCQTYFPIIESLYQNYSMSIKASMHTIATIQAKMSQKIEPFIKDAQKGKQEERLKTVEKNLLNKSGKENADLICFLGKRIEELDIHLESLKILDSNIGFNLSNLKKHPLHKILLNTYDPFKQAFDDKNIKVVFDRVDENIKIRIDYKVFNLIFHHFFDNAAKYSKANDKIEFIFSSNRDLVVKMHSLKIEDVNSIFKKGISGNNSGELAGDGIGMFVIKKSLQIMNMDISLIDKGRLNNHPQYHKNEFIINCNI